MCHQQSQVCLTADEQVAGEESLSVYCKPVEFYNILQKRASKNPSFLQRCLQYKIRAKHQRRIRITVSLSRAKNVVVHSKDVFPLHVLLGRPFADVTVTQTYAIYQISQTGVVTSFSEFGKKDQVEATFVIPEIKKLATDTRIRILNIILVRNAELAGNCLWGKIPIDSFCSSSENCAALSVGHQTEMLSTVNLHPGVSEPSFLENCLTLHSRCMDSMCSYQVQVSVRAQEIGAKEKSPYNSYSYDDVPTSSLTHIKRLRSGNVVFNYGYYNNRLRKTEVTEDFSCPFCLVKCASFKGLKCHLTASHDLFHFEFEESEEYQAVNVSVRTDIQIFEVDPKLDSFFYCSKFRRHRRAKKIFQAVSHVRSHVLESDLPEAAQEGFHDNYPWENGTHSSCRPISYPTDASFVNKHNDNGFYKEEKLQKSLFNETQLLSAKHKAESFGLENRHAADCIEPVSSSPDTTVVCATTAQASTGNDCAQPVSESSLAPVNALQYPKTQKPCVKRANRRNCSLLQKRQFFHSHGYQPMALEEVLSDQDGEDEMDNDVADIEDRMMFDEFVKMTKDEKQIMHLWNSFVRRQRVVADGHIPWACEAFSRLHGQDLVRDPGLLWCWRLLMIKLWNHALLDAQTMNNCNLILEGFQNKNPDPKQS
ncbi:polycomb group protein EMF2B-like [Phoenix dactylifera]|uniref:Polycomb group protein EMF2B-like n=1 Tax=Phoenix dactylifera TaxID=42345 RepID=A0A8B8ZBQ4_PHODC|nr:polycomb group protein EMF2B-like [Phoenix dactylifera]